MYGIVAITNVCRRRNHHFARKKMFLEIFSVSYMVKKMMPFTI